MLHPVIASREVTRYILDTFGLHTKQRFGQNFLINESVVRGIAEKAKIGPGDLVLEVGPGIGTLTQALAETGADVLFQSGSQTRITFQQPAAERNTVGLVVEFLRVQFIKAVQF